MIETSMTYLLGLERSHKRIIQLLADSGIIFASFMLAMALRLERLDFIFDPYVWLGFAVLCPVSLVIFVRLGFYRAIIRYISPIAIRTIVIGVLASAAFLFALAQFTNIPVPRSVPAIYALLALFMLGGIRVMMRRVLGPRKGAAVETILIYGAGAAGRQLLGTLREGGQFRAVGFLDDDPKLHGTDIGGLRVYDPATVNTIINRRQVSLVLLAIPSATQLERKTVVDRLEEIPVRVQTIPGIADLVSGRAKVSEITDVAIEDLLGRDPVPPRVDLMETNIRGKVVMVTGAGGSIGSELCRQILRQKPATLVLWELSELALYTLDLELREMLERDDLGTRIISLMGSVQNPNRLGRALKRYGVQTIYHAAAYKHVPLVESNVVEGLRNNVFGTRVVADQAIEANVEAVILVSTDKAVRPTNIMGASKRLAELVCQAAALSQSKTQFSMVRFGNVLGSSGSVIPRFRKQIQSGGPVTVTHPEITRYFMTIPEAAQLVIQAGAMAQGGDVFVLDMGEPIRIVDLAERIVRLSGLTPFHAGECSTHVAQESSGDIPICFTGLRPGEKLYEELLIGDASKPTDHPRILTATEDSLTPEELDTLLERIFEACHDHDIALIRQLIKNAPTGYKPDSDIVDLIWQEHLTEEVPRLAGE